MSIYRDGEPAKRASEGVRQAKRRLVGIVGSATACNDPWRTMPGDACVRRCPRCPKDVYDLDAMNESQIEDLAAAVEADASATNASTPLVRFHRRADGRFLLGGCPVDLARAKVRKRNQWLVGVFAVMIVLIGMQSLTRSAFSSVDEGSLAGDPAR